MFHKYLILSSQFYDVDAVISFIFQMRKLRPRGFKQPVQSHTANDRQSQDLNPIN